MSSTRRKSEAAGSLTSFLTTYRVDRGCEFTHTSLSKPVGSFYIPVDMLNTFYTLYIDAFESDVDLHITEKHRHIGPIVVDCDFRFEKNEEQAAALTRQYTSKDIDGIINLYVKNIVDLIQFSEGSSFEVYVLEKEAPSMSNGLIKDGIHIMMPSIVTRPSVQHLIRKRVLDEVSMIWDHLKLSNDYANVIDEAVIERNNWLMYGSKKPTGEPYKITRVLKCDVASNGAFMIKEVEKNKEESAYVEVLSIRNKYMESETKIDKKNEIEAFEKLLESKRQRLAMSRNILTSDESSRKNTCDNLELVKKLVDILDREKRSSDYNHWIRLGWCLRNIDHRLLEVWDNFSKHSSKYVVGECENLWNHMRGGGLGIGTLHMWAKDDNVDAYKEIIRQDLKTQLESSYKYAVTHHDVAKVIYEMYKHDFVCASIKNRIWYEFRNHRWNATDTGYTLRIKISTDVCQEYVNEAIRLQRLVMTTNDGDLKELSENIKKCQEIVIKLKQQPFKESLMKECSELFYQEKFEEKLDSNTHLIGFENGVYDMEMMEFRQGHPEDYITFTTGINFIPYQINHPCVQSVHKYLEQVLPKAHIREYVLKLFASFLNGAIKEQKFHIWTGSGSNSKSKLVELFEKSFGDYCCKFPVTMLTQKRIASNSANSELARAKGKRFACLQEPSEDEKISVGQLKEYSGGDKIIARALFKEPVEFTPQFKMLLLCNHLPHVPSDDGGTWRRIRVVEFTSKFVEDPKEENEFPIDLELSSKMEDWKDHFMALLIEVYKKYIKEGIKEPDEVTVCTREYKRQNDHLADFIHNCIEPSEGVVLSLNEAFSELKTWIKDDNIPLKAPTKPELEKYLSKNLIKATALSSGSTSKAYRGFRLRNRYAQGGPRDMIDE